MTVASKRKKIAMVTWSFSRGGAGVAAQRLCDALQVASGVSVERYSTDLEDRGADHKLLYPLGIPGADKVLRKMLNPIARRMSATGEGVTSLNMVRTGLGAKINKINADLINLHWVAGEILSIGELLSIQRPVLWTQHDEWLLNPAEHYTPEFESGANMPYGTKHSWLWRNCRDHLLERKRRLLTKPNFVFVFPSRWLYKNFVDAGLDEKRGLVIPNPLHQRYFAEQAQPIREGSEGLIKIGFVAAGGTDEKRKGFESFSRVLVAVSEAMRNCRVQGVVVGGLPKPAVQLGKNCEMRFIGRVAPADMPSVYRTLSFFLLLSAQDNLPQTLIEAAAVGVPCVAYSVGGVPEIVDEKLGVGLVPFGKEELVVRQICGLLGNAQMTEAYSTRLRADMKERFSPEVVAARFTTVAGEFCGWA